MSFQHRSLDTGSVFDHWRQLTDRRLALLSKDVARLLQRISPARKAHYGCICAGGQLAIGEAELQACSAPAAEVYPEAAPDNLQYLIDLMHRQGLAVGGRDGRWLTVCGQDGGYQVEQLTLIKQFSSACRRRKMIIKCFVLKPTLQIDD